MAETNCNGLPATYPKDMTEKLKESFVLRALVSKRLVIVAHEFSQSVTYAVANGGKQMLTEALQGIVKAEDEVAPV